MFLLLCFSFSFDSYEYLYFNHNRFQLPTPPLNFNAGTNFLNNGNMKHRKETTFYVT